MEKTSHHRDLMNQTLQLFSFYFFFFDSAHFKHLISTHFKD